MKKRILHILLSLVLIAVWCYITYLYYGVLSGSGFHWMSFLYMPLYLVGTYLFLINSVRLIIAELKGVDDP